MKNPKYADLYFYLAKIYEEEGRKDDAKQLYREYIQKVRDRKQNSEDSQRLVESHFFLKNYAKTIELCNTALEKVKSAKLF